MATVFTTAIKIVALTRGAHTELQALTKRSAELTKELNAIGKGRSGAVLVEDYRKLRNEIELTEKRIKSLQAVESARTRLFGARKDPAPIFSSLANRAGIVRDRFASLARDAAILGGAAAAAATVPLVQFAKFETAIAEVSTLVDTSKVKTNDLARSVRNLATQYGADHIDTAKALYATISSGISDVTKATEVLNIANRLAIGGSTDVATAVTGLTSSVNAYAAAQLTAAEAADAFFVASAIGQATPEALANSIGQIAPTAVNAGVSFNDLTAAIGAITTVIPSTEQSVSGIRGVLTAVLDPSAQARKEAKRLGIEFNASALKAKGLHGFILQLANAQGFNAESAAKLFGRVEAANAVQVLAANGAKVLTDAIEQMGNKAGATDKAFEKLSQSTERQFAVLRSRANDVLITIGSRLAPAAGRALNQLSEWVTQNQDRIEEWANRAAKWIETRLIPAVKKIAPEILRLAERVGGLIEKASQLAGGFDNLVIAAVAFRAIPLAASVVQWTVEVVKAIVWLGRYVAATWSAVAAQRALAVAQAAAGGGGVVGGASKLAAAAGGAARIVPHVAAFAGGAAIGASIAEFVDEKTDFTGKLADSIVDRNEGAPDADFFSPARVAERRRLAAARRAAAPVAAPPPAPVVTSGNRSQTTNNNVTVNLNTGGAPVDELAARRVATAAADEIDRRQRDRDRVSAR